MLLLVTYDNDTLVITIMVASLAIAKTTERSKTAANLFLFLRPAYYGPSAPKCCRGAQSWAFRVEALSGLLLLNISTDTVV